MSNEECTDKPSQLIVNDKLEYTLDIGDEYSKFMEWFVDVEGFQNSGQVVIGNSSITGRGLYTTEHTIKINNTFLNLPYERIINSTNVVNFRNYKSDYFIDKKGFDFLVIFVLYEKLLGKRSLWAKYFNVLPDKFETLPLFWSKKSLKLDFIKAAIHIPPTFVQGLKDAKQNIKMCRERLLLNAPENLVDLIADKKAFRWAYCVVATRAVYLQAVDSQFYRHDPFCLVPFFDFFNHSFDYQVKIVTSVENGMQFIARQEIGKHTHLYIQYSSEDNRHFLLNYGFVDIRPSKLINRDQLIIYPSMRDCVECDMIQFEDYLDLDSFSRKLLFPLYKFYTLDIDEPKKFQITWPTNWSKEEIAIIFISDTQFKVTQPNFDILNVDSVLNLAIAALQLKDSDTELESTKRFDLISDFSSKACTNEMISYCKTWVALLKKTIAVEYGFNLEWSSKEKKELIFNVDKPLISELELIRPEILRTLITNELFMLIILCKVWLIELICLE